MPVVFQAIRQQDGHTDTVRDAADGADRMPQGMNHAHHGVGEGSAGQGGCIRQGQTAIPVTGIFHNLDEMGADQINGQQGVGIAEGIFGQAGIGLHGMGQGIHARRSGDCGGKRQGHAGIENSHIGQEKIADKEHLQMSFMILDNGRQRRLRTGS